jgi:putative ABC transport system ATP-binding protein
VTAAEILTLMKDLNEKEGVTFVFSTHDQSIISMAKRVFNIKDGQEIKKI